MKPYNLAAALGLRVIRFTPQMLETTPFDCLVQIEQALDVDVLISHR
jgi:hypothetical protein